MNTLLLYRKDTERERLALDYARDFKMRTGKELTLTDVDTPEGAEICRLYDIIDYPAILVRDDDGHVQNLWMGENLPPFDEVSYFVQGQQGRV